MIVWKCLEEVYALIGVRCLLEPCDWGGATRERWSNGNSRKGRVGACRSHQRSGYFVNLSVSITTHTLMTAGTACITELEQDLNEQLKKF